MSQPPVALSCILVLSWAAPGLPQEPLVPYLLKDLNHPFRSSSDPRGFLEASGIAYFSADDGIHGRELWRTDGTAAGTRLVKDVWPGVGNSVPQPFAALGERLFFWAGDGDRYGLWITDGTPEGTSFLREIIPNGCGNTSLVDGRLFFCASGGGNDDLWVSGGTPESTMPFRQQAGLPDSWRFPGLPISHEGSLYLAADDGEHGSELWQSEGTPGTTVLVKDIAPGATDSSPALNPSMGSLAGRFFFLTYDESGLENLWASDGTSDGTVRLSYLLGLAPGRVVSPWGVAGGRLFFRVYDGSDLWTSDLTRGGTVRFRSVVGLPASRSTEVPIELGGKLYFARSGGRSGAELRTSGWTPASSKLLKDSIWGSPFAVGSRVFFNVLDPGLELWTTDGTPEGTVSFRTLAGLKEPLSLTAGPVAVAGKWVFGVSDGFTGTDADDGTRGNEPWVSDGTPAGTSILKDILPTSPAPEGPPGFFCGPSRFSPHFSIRAPLGTSSGGKLLRGLTVSDGTPEGTRLLEDVLPADLVVWGGALLEGRLFVLAGRDGTAQLWTSQGTPESAALVVDTATIGPAASIEEMLPVEDRLFIVLDSSGEKALLTVDGTTGVLGDYILLGEFRIPLREQLDLTLTSRAIVVSAGRRIFFLAEDPNGRDTWLGFSDGTFAGTQILEDVPGHRFGIVAAGDHVFFFQTDASAQRLWITDGTQAGTRVVWEIPQGPPWIAGAAAVGGKLFFETSENDGSRSLWVSDGTPEGTEHVEDLVPGGRGSLADTAGDRLLLVGCGVADEDCDVWISDGTRAGTSRFRDLLGKPGTFQHTIPTVADGRFFFAADDGVHGFELWQSDGTPGGTGMVQDILPGEGSSLLACAGSCALVADPGAGGVGAACPNGNGIAVPALISSSSGGVFFFLADDGVHGPEL